MCFITVRSYGRYIFSAGFLIVAGGMVISYILFLSPPREAQEGDPVLGVDSFLRHVIVLFLVRSLRVSLLHLHSLHRIDTPLDVSSYHLVVGTGVVPRSRLGSRVQAAANLNTVHFFFVGRITVVSLAPETIFYCFSPVKFIVGTSKPDKFIEIYFVRQEN